MLVAVYVSDARKPEPLRSPVKSPLGPGVVEPVVLPPLPFAVPLPGKLVYTKGAGGLLTELLNVNPARAVLLTVAEILMVAMPPGLRHVTVAVAVGLEKLPLTLEAVVPQAPPVVEPVTVTGVVRTAFKVSETEISKAGPVPEFVNVNW